MKHDTLIKMLSLAGCPLSAEQERIVQSIEQDGHTFPKIATVSEINAYTEWLCQRGKGDYPMIMSEHYLAVIPADGNRFCDDSKAAFLTAVFR